MQAEGLLSEPEAFLAKYPEAAPLFAAGSAEEEEEPVVAVKEAPAKPVEAKAPAKVEEEDAAAGEEERRPWDGSFRGAGGSCPESLLADETPRHFARPFNVVCCSGGRG